MKAKKVSVVEMQWCEERGEVVEKGQAAEVKKEMEEDKKTEEDQRKDLQRNVNTHLHTHCQIESMLDKLIHPRLNWLTGTIRQSFKMSSK